MLKIERAEGSVADTTERLEAALKKRSFGVLHVHDLKATLNSKGVPFESECRILEVCNPQQAARVLSEDIDMNMALPCRVSVYEKDGATCIGMIPPGAMLESFSDSPALRAVADEVERILDAAIDEAATGD